MCNVINKYLVCLFIFIFIFHRELQSDLERCEPRVLSLQEAASYLLDENTETRERLQILKLRLQSLKRLTSMYVLKLGSALGIDPGLTTSTPSLAMLSRDVSYIQ